MLRDRYDPYSLFDAVPRLALRFEPDFATVDRLLLSATRADDLAAVARDLGAAAWLPKPFDLDALLAAVARLTAAGPSRPPRDSPSVG